MNLPTNTLDLPIRYITFYILITSKKIICKSHIID